MKMSNKHKKSNVKVETNKDFAMAQVELPNPSKNSEVDMAVQLDDDDQKKKCYRKRHKHYYNAIRAQMEFYFGDANLSKDRFLKQLIDKDPYVPLNIFMTFNKMKALTIKVEDIAKSLSNSQLLELDETEQKVKRKTQLEENRNVDDKTLYVEALPSTADHEWVRQIFERFGKVAYISLPKYTKSRRIKEFGFVEFEKEESVNKAIKTFKSFNGVLNMQQKDPSELVSIKSYLKVQSGKKEEQIETTSECKKRTKDNTTTDEMQPKAKKFKESEDETENSNTENAPTSQSEHEANTVNVNEEKEECNLKKKKRKLKKKSKTAEQLKLQAELNTDVAYYELKILPKKDWKKLRNKYLNLQREKVSELKRKAWREQQELRQYKDSTITEDNSILPAGQQEQKKNVKAGSKHKLQEMNMNFYRAAEEELKVSNAEKTPQQNPALERAPLYSYTPGLIVEISFLEPCINVKEFKADMRQYSTVKYVDVKEGAMQAYLRLETSQKAAEFVQHISCAEYQCKILSDEAETNYWQKIDRDREEKLNKQVNIPKKRGREKVKKLISKHIRFGDDVE